jgi:hypothetical protein
VHREWRSFDESEYQEGVCGQVLLWFFVMKLGEIKLCYFGSNFIEATFSVLIGGYKI